MSFFTRQKWLLVLIVGILLFFATEQALKYTENPSYFPTVLLIGSFIIPVTFVTYIYQRERRMDVHPDSPVVPAVLCFLVGGAIGVIVAGVVEFQTLRNTNIVYLFSVGLIEESAKLIFPVFLFLRGRFRTEMDGILFGVATGMGFASLETMGYGLVSFLNSSGNINVLEQVLFARGLFSPVGHAAWTGLVCAMLWRERQRRGRVLFSGPTFFAFVIAILLHTAWNLSASLSTPRFIDMFIALLGNLAVAALSMTILVRRLRESRRYAEKLSPA